MNFKIEELFNRIGQIHQLLSEIVPELQIIKQVQSDILISTDKIFIQEQNNTKLLETLDQKVSGIESKIRKMTEKMAENAKNSKLRFYIGVAILLICWIFLMIK